MLANKGAFCGINQAGLIVRFEGWGEEGSESSVL